MRTMALFLTLLPGIAMACTPLTDHTLRPLASDDSVNLCEAFENQVLLVVNTASKCGYTPQFDGLEALHTQFNDQGFSVLGFPSDNFGNQEFVNEDESLEFCRLTYGVKFPMFAHTNAAERNADPIFKALGSAAGRYPSWNFHKYLIGRDGQLIADYPSSVTPQDLIPAIQDALAN